MNSFLKQSTASQSRAIGPFLDDTDFKTPETGLTIANTDIKLVVNGGASANKNSGGGTHRVNGVYGITFDATDTATVGEMEVSVVVSGALPVFHTFVVVEEAVYDMLFGASAIGYIADQPVNTTKVGGTTQTARDLGASVLLSAGTGTGQLDFTSGVVKANVTQFGGTNATSTGGRPEVNTTHIAGSAVSTTSAQIGVNVVQISTDATAADNAEAFFDGTGYAGTNNVIPLVTTTTTATNLTNAATNGDFTATMKTSIGTAVAASAVASVTGNVGGNVVGSVASVVGNVGGNVVGSVASVVGNVGGNVAGSVASVTANVTADVRKINNTTVTGNGSSVPWGP